MNDISMIGVLLAVLVMAALCALGIAWFLKWSMRGKSKVVIDKAKGQEGNASETMAQQLYDQALNLVVLSDDTNHYQTALGEFYRGWENVRSDMTTWAGQDIFESLDQEIEDLGSAESMPERVGSANRVAMHLRRLLGKVSQISRSA